MSERDDDLQTEQSMQAAKAASLLLETLQSRDLQDAVVLLTEARIGEILGNGLSKTPVAGPLVSLIRAVRSIRDQLFARKLVMFLGPLRALDPERRSKMLARLESDPTFGERVGDHVILLLDHLDNLQKATMMGRAFRAYVEERIDGAMLRRLNYVVDRVVMSDLPYVTAFAGDPEGSGLSPAALQGLINAGLAHVPPDLLNPHVWPLPEVCDAFVDHVLDDGRGTPRTRWRAPWPPSGE